MKTYSSIHILYNPNSTGDSEALAKNLHKRLSKRYTSIPVEIKATQYAGHAEELAYKFARASRQALIISSSGDGGYNEVINGAMKARQKGATPICAVIAGGNANDHRRTMKKQPLAKAVEAEEVTKLDLLQITLTHGTKRQTRFAHSYAGLGITPIAAVELNRRNLNALREMWIVVKTFYKFRPFKIKLDSKVFTLDSVLFMNIGQMAKILNISNTSKPDDGLFEVVAMPHAHKLKLLSKIIRASTAGLSPEEHYKEYEFTVLKKMPMQIDGEVVFVAKDTQILVEARKQILRTVL